ncbi:hypothetical protein N7466_000540 [Penicillium verhagenii]|uniref:uncharacterized protein n=1 Tax=Penicillium verhagenii TaxID=1562060 RepID=UPI002544ED1C|nr:uncharacterized protein N7466_000540 [Penicillium verhagenii]KAJ5947525.1 hypothetical protein N7466_000540 [Penicillium verhagenii]
MPIDLSNRGAILALKSQGLNPYKISDVLGIPRSTIKTIINKAVESGFDPEARPLAISDELLATHAAGRQPKQSDA